MEAVLRDCVLRTSAHHCMRVSSAADPLLTKANNARFLPQRLSGWTLDLRGAHIQALGDAEARVSNSHG